MTNRQKIVTDILDNLEHSYSKNSWFSLPEGQIYLRLASRYDLGKTLDIVSVEMYEEYQGQGIFTQYLRLFEEEAYQRGYAAIVIEQVINKGLYKSLKRQGYRDMYEITLSKIPEELREQVLPVLQQQSTSVYKLL